MAHPRDASSWKEKPVAGSLFDFGMYSFTTLIGCSEGQRTVLYLPKLESHLEARLWNDVFNFAQDDLGIRVARSVRPS